MSAVILAFDAERPGALVKRSIVRDFAALTPQSQAWILDLVSSLLESEGVACLAEAKGGTR